MTIKRLIRRGFRKINDLLHLFDLIGFLGFCYVWLVGRTGKFRAPAIDAFDEMVKANNGGIFVTWHGRALMLPYFWHNICQMKALVSPHRDGRIIARLLKCFHILSIDGSSDRQANSAALDIVKELNKGTVVALISDGPRGPRMRLNKSVIYFAQKTGKPVMGVTYSARGAKVTNGWDAMLVPKLFSEGVVLATKPLFVPAEADDEQKEKLRLQFEEELNALTLAADKEFGVPLIEPQDTRKFKKRRERRK